MTTIIAIKGRKGGITKSTTTVQVAAALAMLGKRVVVLETDGQGSSSNMMGMQATDAFFRLIADDSEWSDVTVKVDDKFAGDVELYLVSSGDRQMLLEQNKIQLEPEYAQQPARVDSILYDRLTELREANWADYVLVDTGPHITDINSVLFYASDYVIFPTLIKDESLSILKHKTLAYYHSAKQKALESNAPVAELLCIVPAMYKSQGTATSILFSMLRNDFSEYPITEPIREGTIWEASAMTKQSIAVMRDDPNYNLRRQARKAYKDLLHVVNAITSKEVDHVN
jgi:chromosome partitioning protein